VDCGGLVGSDWSEELGMAKWHGLLGWMLPAVTGTLPVERNGGCKAAWVCG